MPNPFKTADINLDLHGYTLERAMLLVQQTLDTVKNHGKSVLIIHGHGRGILRDSVREYLKTCPVIKKVCYGEEYFLPGGAGVTLVFL